MTRDKTIMLGVALLALVAAFYLLVLSPKRGKAAELATEISTLEASISEQEQVATFGEQARHDFPRYYGRLVVLGKAVPQQADTASLLVELNKVAASSSVDFRGITLSDAAASSSTTSTPAPAPAAAPAAEAAPSAEGSTPASSGTSTTSTTPTTASAPTASTTSPAAATTAAPATEASAATLPIGATVGAAGLPTMPYDLTFTGGFFGIADYIGGLDSLVRMRERGGQVAAHGRLITVDGFSLEATTFGPNPVLDASFSVTTFVTPSEQGLTAGATPTAPAPATATPASAVTR